MLYIVVPTIFVIMGIIYATRRNNRARENERMIDMWRDEIAKSYLFDKDGKPHGHAD